MLEHRQVESAGIVEIAAVPVRYSLVCTLQ